MTAIRNISINKGFVILDGVSYIKLDSISAIINELGKIRFILNSGKEITYRAESDKDSIKIISRIMNNIDENNQKDTYIHTESVSVSQPCDDMYHPPKGKTPYLTTAIEAKF